MSPSASSFSSTPPPGAPTSPSQPTAASAVDCAAAAATRSLQEADAPPPVLSAPASQESFTSRQTGQSSVGAQYGVNSSSNASQWTSHTDLTLPTNGVPNGRLRTPDPAQAPLNTQGQHDTVPASPITANGTKRTASGSVKSTTPSTPFTTTFPVGRKPRTESMSSTGSRAGDLALSLKTRLEYAMAKVQHGWEHKNIHEVERLARSRSSPNEWRRSMSHLDYASRRPVTMRNGHPANRSSAYEQPNGHYVYDGSQASQPSKRHSGTYGFVSSSQPTLGTVPRLQPAADIQPSSSSQPLQHQYQNHHHYNKLASPNGYYNNASMMSPPRTPVNGTSSSRSHCPPTIRTETQTAEAEREALQALTQLSSPHGSQHVHTFQHHASQVSSSQGSPLRSEFATPRRVTFARSESDNSSAGNFSSEEGAVADEAALHNMVEV